MNAIVARIAAAVFSVTTTFVLFNAVVSLSEPQAAQASQIVMAKNTNHAR